MRQPGRDAVSPVRTSQVALHLPSALRALAGGATEVTVPSGTLGDAITDLQKRHPAFVRAIRTQTGGIRPHVNLFVNREDIRQLRGLKTELKPGDVVIILPSISGG
jgi:molybdopterin converting factor small subunit